MADFFFVIPRWALATGSDVPSQCLSLPPSLCVGEIVSQQSESYAQPRISYHLNVIARCLSEDVSQPKLYQSFKEITVIPYTESMPPIDTRDFPSEFIESSSKLFRKSHFGGPTYLMKLSMNEPPAIRLHNTQLAGITDAEIAVEITATGEKLKDSALKQLPDLLRELTFHVAPICRAKTFYSTTPFRKLPGQTMLHFRSNLRLHDEKSRLRTSHVTTTSWQHQNQDAESSHGAVSVSGPGSPLLLDNGPRKWNTRIHLPVEIPPGLLPTFCSAIVARQYSLIIQVTVTGANVGQFILEVPLQVTYGPLSSAESGMTAEDGFEWYNPGTSSTSASPLTIHELLGQDNVSLHVIGASESLVNLVCRLQTKTFLVTLEKKISPS